MGFIVTKNILWSQAQVGVEIYLIVMATKT